MLLRPADGSWQILLVHKPRKRDAWQLPQGGMEEGENPQQCAVRELQEEAGVTGVTVLGQSSIVYQYDFPASYRRFRPDHICGQCIHFVYGTVGKDVVVTVDNKEINGFRWVTVKELSRYLKRKEYLDLTKNLYEEAVAAAR